MLCLNKPKVLAHYSLAGNFEGGGFQGAELDGSVWEGGGGGSGYSSSERTNYELGKLWHLSFCPRTPAGLIFGWSKRGGLVLGLGGMGASNALPRKQFLVSEASLLSSRPVRSTPISSLPKRTGS